MPLHLNHHKKLLTLSLVVPGITEIYFMYSISTEGLMDFSSSAGVVKSASPIVSNIYILEIMFLMYVYSRIFTLFIIILYLSIVESKYFVESDFTFRKLNLNT